MTEKLQIWEDNNGFYILTDKAEIKDGAWFQDNDDDVIVAVVDKDLKDAELKAEDIVHRCNMHTELVEALEKAIIMCSANDKKCDEVFGTVYRELMVDLKKTYNKATNKG